MMSSIKLIEQFCCCLLLMVSPLFFHILFRNKSNCKHISDEVPIKWRNKKKYIFFFSIGENVHIRCSDFNELAKHTFRFRLLVHRCLDKNFIVFRKAKRKKNGEKNNKDAGKVQFVQIKLQLKPRIIFITFDCEY